MEIGLIILAIMLATLLGWLLKASFNATPWVAEAVEEAEYQAPFNARPRLVGLTMFLAVVTSFFALLLSAYTLRMDYGDWIPLNEPQILWFNTAVLVLASIAFQWTRNAATEGRVMRLKPGLLAAGLLTLVFLAGQVVAWQQLHGSGQYLDSNPSTAFFYVLTGLHALHIAGGMFVWARATLRQFGGGEDVTQSIELCTIYWHFLLLVWLVLFGMMVST